MVPKALGTKALRVAHAGHPGQSAMKSIMRKRIWWPEMSMEIERWVLVCNVCISAAQHEPPVLMLRTTFPEAPCDKLVIDYNGKHSSCGGRNILVLVDY